MTLALARTRALLDTPPPDVIRRQHMPDTTDQLRTAVDLLSDAESYLSALHVHVARHDNLGADLTCGGCQLRDRIAPALAVARQVLGTTTGQPETEAPVAERTRTRWAMETYDSGAKEWVPSISFLLRKHAVERLEQANKTAPFWRVDNTPVQRRLVRETTTYTVEPEAAEAQQPTPDVAEETVAACKCGHPQERHALLNGTYAQCRHKYTEAGRPKCPCGMYRPQSDAPAPAEETK